MLILSTGTGSRVDEEDLAQPFLTYLTSVVKRTRPVLLFAKRFDRLGRRAWGLGASLDVMKMSLPAFIGDQNGILPLDEMTEMRVFMEASRAEGFAATIPKQTRRGMRSRTGVTMEDGRVAYGLASVPPPGFTRLTLLGSGLGGNGNKVICLEQSGCLPPREQVALGYPEVIDPATGEVRDQVANVRWALEKLADRRWSMEAIGQGLIARQFSHTKIRESRGPSAIAEPQRRAIDQKRHGYSAKNTARSIVKNLDLYETGTLRRSLGVEGVDDVEITNLFPVDGKPWASKETFKSIRDRLGENHRSWSSRRGLVLSGLHVTVNGQECVLRTVSEPPEQTADSAQEKQRYSVRDAQCRNPVRLGVCIPHAGLARVIAEALDHAAQAELALPPMDVPSSVRDDIQKAEHRATIARMRSDEAKSRGELIYRRVSDPATSGALLVRLQEEYNSLVQGVIPDLSHQIAAIEEEVAQLKSKADQLRGCSTETLAVLVRDLADATCLDHKEEIHHLISGLDIRMERVDTGVLKGWTAHIAVQLALTEENGKTFCLEHTGAIHIAGAENRARQVRELVDSRLDGRRTESRPLSVGMRDAAEHLGLRGRQVHIMGIRDARLFAIALRTAQLHNGGAPEADVVKDVADELAESEVLVRRVFRMYAPGAVGRDSRWWKERLTWRIRPALVCPHCGHPAIRAPLIAEIHLGVCPDCRLDPEGVRWGSEYDEFLVVQTEEGPRTLTGKAPKWKSRGRDEFDAWPR